MEINILPKGHSKLTSNLKKPACASKQDGLVLATLRYLFRYIVVTFLTRGHREPLDVHALRYGGRFENLGV